MTGGLVRIDVALLPAEARRWHGMVCILLDELRASSTIVTLLERGASEVVPAASLAEARRIAAADPAGTILAGEHHVVAPPDFDAGNSPAELMRMDVEGKRAVLSTRNGTAVLRSLPPGAMVLVGCLLDARAVAEASLALARARGEGIGIVCAGRRGSFAIDDAIAAGCLLERILELGGVDDRALPTVDGRQERTDGSGGTAVLADPVLADPVLTDPVLTDAARAALQLWRSTDDVDAAFRASWSGHLLASHGLLEDIPASTRIDATDLVPVVVPGPPPRIVRM
jgi:2-phosphosulfolactate phosphatase